MSDTRPSTDGDYYELRLYEMVQARLPAFHDLMERHAPPLFARHGFSRPLAFWEGFSGPIAPLYGYLLRWPNLDERMRAWGAFYSDPDWVAAMNASYAGEQRVERVHISFIKASPLWNRFRREGGDMVGGVYELRRYDVSGLDERQYSKAIGADLAFLEEKGGRVLGVFENHIGAPCPRVAAFIAWPSDGEAWRQALAANTGDDGRDKTMLHVPRDGFLLRPTAYGCARESFSAHPGD